MSLVSLVLVKLALSSTCGSSIIFIILINAQKEHKTSKGVFDAYRRWEEDKIKIRQQDEVTQCGNWEKKCSNWVV